MPVVAVSEGDALMLRIDGEDTAVAQRDAVGVVWPGSLRPASVRQRDVWHKGPSACGRARRTSEYGWQVSGVPNRAGATLPRQVSERARPGTCLGRARQALERERGTCAVWASATLCHPDLMLRR